MIIYEDMGQKEGEHKVKNRYFKEHGIDVKRVPLPVGDYIIATDKSIDVVERKNKRRTDVKKMDFLGTYDVTVDTKKDMQEIVGNICGKAHARFRDECILAQNNGIKLYILIENTDGIKEVRDVFKWQNPRTHRYNKINYMHNLGKWSSILLPKAKPTSGQTLAKAMLTMEKKYGVEFKFCKPKEAGEEIINLLNKE